MYSHWKMKQRKPPSEIDARNVSFVIAKEAIEFENGLRYDFEVDKTGWCANQICSSQIYIFLFIFLW